MTQEVVALARRRLAEADETLAEGEYLLKGKHYRGALNRFFYSGLYAARALLAFAGVDASSHHGVITLLHKHFVQRGVIDAKVAKMLRRTLDRRIETDYGDFAVISREEIEGLHQSMQQFLGSCKEAVDKLASPAQ